MLPFKLKFFYNNFNLAFILIWTHLNNSSDQDFYKSAKIRNLLRWLQISCLVKMNFPNIKVKTMYTMIKIKKFATLYWRVIKYCFLNFIESKRKKKMQTGETEKIMLLASMLKLIKYFLFNSGTYKVLNKIAGKFLNPFQNRTFKKSLTTFQTLTIVYFGRVKNWESCP